MNRLRSRPIMRRLCVLLVFFVLGCDRVASQAAHPWHVGAPAPPFRLPVISDATLTADTVDLAQLQGRVVVLNFWATWCGPCTAEHPTFAALARSFAADSVQFLGVVFEDSPRAVLEFERDDPSGYPNLHDRGGGTSKSYGVSGIPHHVVINRSGRIVFSAPGGPIGEEPFAAVLRAALAGQADSCQSTTAGTCVPIR
jgi:cytochrome c biogenesis protein CcmG, thiol:disulfide interchange protein DsbE